MTLKRNTFEGFAVGVTPTVGTSGGANGDALSQCTFSGSTGTIVDSPVLQAARALRIVATTGTGILGLAGVAGRFHSAQFDLRLAANPAVSFALGQFRILGGGAIATITSLTTGALQFTGAAGVGTFTSPVLALDTNYRVDWRIEIDVAPTTANGKMRASIVRKSDAVEVFAYTSDAVNLGTANPGEVRYGKTGGTAAADFYLDALGYDDNLQAFITPLSDFTAPVLAALVESPVGEVDLSWGAVPTATGYRVERSITSAVAGFTTLATLGNVLVYSDTGRPPATQYWYRVFATK